MSKEQIGQPVYTYCLGGGVRQDFEDCVSLLEEPCLSGPLENQRYDCCLTFTESDRVHEQLIWMCC